MNYAQPKPPVRRIGGIAFVVGLHAVIVYALLTGLATKVVDVIRQPIETRIIEEIKPPPPPPPPKHIAPPPPKHVAPRRRSCRPGSARRCTAFAKRDRRAVDHARAVGPVAPPAPPAAAAPVSTSVGVVCPTRRRSAPPFAIRVKRSGQPDRRRRRVVRGRHRRQRQGPERDPVGRARSRPGRGKRRAAVPLRRTGRGSPRAGALLFQARLRLPSTAVPFPLGNAFQETFMLNRTRKAALATALFLAASAAHAATDTVTNPYGLDALWKAGISLHAARCSSWSSCPWVAGTSSSRNCSSKRACCAARRRRRQDSGKQAVSAKARKTGRRQPVPLHRRNWSRGVRPSRRRAGRTGRPQPVGRGGHRAGDHIRLEPPAGRPRVSRHRRFDRAVHWPVRHGVGHLSRADGDRHRGRPPSTRSRGRSARR